MTTIVKYTLQPMNYIYLYKFSERGAVNDGEISELKHI